MSVIFSESAKTVPAGVPILGILALDTGFPRSLGDVGNQSTWHFPTILRCVEGATPMRVAGRKAEGLLGAFVEGGRELIRNGADGIITTCGFLSIFQKQLTEKLSVPVAASSLLLLPMVDRLLPAGRRAGVITYSKAFLGPEHLEGVGAAPDTPVEGIPGTGATFAAITDGADDLDVRAFEAEVVAAGRRLVETRGDIGAIVVECANMPPYSAALREALGLPVYDAVSFVNWFYAGLQQSQAVSPATAR